MEVEWTESALDDMRAFDKGIARRVRKCVERFAEAGAGNVKRLQGIDPSEFRLRVGDYRVRCGLDGETMHISYGFAIANRLIGKPMGMQHAFLGFRCKPLET